MIIDNKGAVNMKLHSCWGKAGFTLAEVLLTMTIVGVVATMTIPTLHYQRVKKEYSAKLKNFYSRMENAILDMEIDKGSFRDMKLPSSDAECFKWYMNNLDPYIGHDFVNKTNGNDAVYFKDGSAIVRFYKGGCIDVIYDTNGDRAPNREGFDRHRFLFCFSDVNRDWHFGNKDIFFGTYGSGLKDAKVTRQQMITKCRTEAPWCTRLLQNDQWEFKSDYPHKF